MNTLRILVAEDEALIRMDLVEMLTESGYEVVAQATNGAEAIELAKEHKPDLAILDVKMPVLDGISAAQEIISIAPDLILEKPKPFSCFPSNTIQTPGLSLKTSAT